MKIRYGFVSNSSSSSFLIAYKPSLRCECCGIKAPDIIVKLEGNPSYSDNEVYAEGKDAVIAYLSRQDFHENMLEIAKNTVLRPGEDLAYIAVSYHDQELNDLLNNNKNIRILHSDN